MYRRHIPILNEEMSQFIGDKFQKPASLHLSNSAFDLVTLTNLQTHSNAQTFISPYGINMWSALTKLLQIITDFYV